ncbi:PTS transporter subunit EIIB [[Clostridium] colinum]|uniref:PTS transporter subunit EIIB n=1 Tax=[Clostridium] colinum TaxID=36835 RepID=UPI0020257B65|nr:PTS transporter subunit EIIB [[Clostridium] colinum]
MTKIDLNSPTEDYAKIILQGLGGKDNIKFMTNCITRLRLVLNDISKIDEDLLIKKTGATKIIINENDVHVVYGIHVEKIKKAIDEAIKNEKSNEGYVGDVNVKKILQGIGGKDNIKDLTNCMTRLRLVLNDVSKIDENLLISETFASKVIVIDEHNVHIVYGLKIEEIRNALEKELKNI